MPGSARVPARGRTLAAGVLFGVGLVAFLDEALFHQILRWHHFYDRGTLELGLVSDGFFHAFSWLATIGGLFLVADLRRRGAFSALGWWGGVLLGAGGFQLYDGLVQHKLLGLHQIRSVPELGVYDLVWNGVAVLLVLAGVLLTVLARRSGPADRASRSSRAGRAGRSSRAGRAGRSSGGAPG